MEEVKKNFQIQLESFEGPLDLLLALIQKNEMDIFNVSVAQITEDYLEYMKIVQTLDLDVAGDFLVIGATLVLMKSRALLPTETPEQEEEEEEDPELLMRRIEEYKQYQSAAEVLREKEQVQKQQFYRESKSSEDLGETIEFYDLNIYDLFSAFKQIITEIGQTQPTPIYDEDWTVDEKMVELGELIQKGGRGNLSDHLKKMKNKIEIIVTFLALLELIRMKRVVARQAGVHGDIWIMRQNPKKVANGTVES